jgi:hypothetical protein
MFPKYGGTKLLMAALGSSLSLYFRSHVIDREVLALFPGEHLWPRKALFEKPGARLSGPPN